MIFDFSSADIWSHDSVQKRLMEEHGKVLTDTMSHVAALICPLS